MSDIQLTTGSIERLLSVAPGDNELWETGHVLQLLSLKKIGAAREGAAPDRFRLVVSDGVHYTQAMLATQLTGMVDEGEISKYSVVKVEKLTCNNVQNKKLLILLALTPVGNPGEKIGDPGALEVPGQNVSSSTEAQATPTTAVNTPVAQQQKPVQSQKPPQQQQQRANGPVVFPIEGLSPYQNKWTIRARVTVKSDVRHYSTPKGGEGKMFNVTLMDDSGEIRATGFNNQVDQFYDKLEEGKVYYVSKARVNLAKKKFSNVQNEYELMLGTETEISECADQAAAPQITYHFVKLSELGNQEKDTTCDVIGIVKDVSDVTEIVAKATGRTIKKRELTLIDLSEFAVRMTLWGKQAESYTAEEHAVLAFKGARVGDFGGRSLSMSNATHMSVNPDINEAHVLRGWFDSLNSPPAFKSHSGGSSSAGGFGDIRREAMKTLLEVRALQENVPDGGENFSCKGTILHIKADNLFYPACPTCNKKVIDGSEGWRCEKCDRAYTEPEYRFMMSMSVADHTGQIWLNGFNDVGLVVFGKTASELHELKERDESAYTAAIARATCNTYNFNCRAKQDTYNEQSRVRFGIQKIMPLDYKLEAGLLRDRLKKMGL